MPNFFQKGYSTSPNGIKLQKSTGYVNAGAQALNLINAAYGATNKAGNALTTITVTNSMTFGQLFRELSQYDIDADIHDGVIKLTSPTGNIVGGDFATTLGINMTL